MESRRFRNRKNDTASWRTIISGNVVSAELIVGHFKDPYDSASLDNSVQRRSIRAWLLVGLELLSFMQMEQPTLLPPDNSPERYWETTSEKENLKRILLFRVFSEIFRT